MAILITGAQGQLGRALRAALTERVVAYGKAELDITRLDVVRAAIDQLRPRIVINAAAFTRVDEAEAAPEPAYRVNALGRATWPWPAPSGPSPSCTSQPITSLTAGPNDPTTSLIPFARCRCTG